MKKVCLICCRKGSKKIKDKNIKLFAGRPMLLWVLKEIKKSKIFDKIILSTDSMKIKKIAEKEKVLVPGLRPKYLAKDNSNQFDTHKYIFKKLKLDDSNDLVCVVNNNPFIKSKYFKKGISCAKCYNKTSTKKKKKLRERNKQIKISKKKGLYNPYIKITTLDY